MKSEDRQTARGCSRGLVLVVSERADAELEEQEVHRVLRENMMHFNTGMIANALVITGIIQTNMVAFLMDCVRVCVCVCERECKYVCVCEREYKCVCVCE